MSDVNPVAVANSQDSPMRLESRDVAPGDPLLLQDILVPHPHVFVGLPIFDGEGEPAPSAGAGGLATIKVKSWVTNAWETLLDPITGEAAVFDFNDPKTLSVSGPILGVHVVPAGATGFTNYRVRIAAFGS